MKTAGLLTSDQVDSVFLNLEELINNNNEFTSRISTAIQAAITRGDTVRQPYKIYTLYRSHFN